MYVSLDIYAYNEPFPLLFSYILHIIESIVTENLKTTIIYEQKYIDLKNKNIWLTVVQMAFKNMCYTLLSSIIALYYFCKSIFNMLWLNSMYTKYFLCWLKI